MACLDCCFACIYRLLVFFRIIDKIDLEFVMPKEVEVLEDPAEYDPDYIPLHDCGNTTGTVSK